MQSSLPSLGHPGKAVLLGQALFPGYSWSEDQNRAVRPHSTSSLVSTALLGSAVDGAELGQSTWTPLPLLVHAGDRPACVRRGPGVVAAAAGRASALPDSQPARLSHRMSPTVRELLPELHNSQCVVCLERLSKPNLESIGDKGGKEGRGREGN